MASFLEVFHDNFMIKTSVFLTNNCCFQLLFWATNAMKSGIDILIYVCLPSSQWNRVTNRHVKLIPRFIRFTHVGVVTLRLPHF